MAKQHFIVLWLNNFAVQFTPFERESYFRIWLDLKVSFRWYFSPVILNPKDSSSSFRVNLRIILSHGCLQKSTVIETLQAILIVFELLPLNFELQFIFSGPQTCFLLILEKHFELILPLKLCFFVTIPNPTTWRFYPSESR